MVNGIGLYLGSNKGTLIPIFDKSVNRFVYSGVLKDGLVDVWQDVEDTVGDPIFQQDDAKIHTARDTITWFAGNNIQVMEWPPNSTDLNLIEHCWKTLKEKLHQRFPNINNTKAGLDIVKRCLAEAFDVVWILDRKADFLESLWESMPRRVAAVLDALGWYTKY